LNSLRVFVPLWLTVPFSKTRMQVSPQRHEGTKRKNKDETFDSPSYFRVRLVLVGKRPLTFRARLLS
jgi:hypothetical protein